uniref:inositol-tetrakisphosphate 1-kinase-like isoform X1 n=2 Tax=Myxine glutinosa TaxID=7769 RepID=UPI00358F7273
MADTSPFTVEGRLVAVVGYHERRNTNKTMKQMHTTVEHPKQLQHRRIGLWISKKKMKKFAFGVLAEACRNRRLELVEVDGSRSLWRQGPFDVLVHKLTDVMIGAQQGIPEDRTMMQHVEEFLQSSPHLIVLDPLPAVWKLVDRYDTYTLLEKLQPHFADSLIYTPSFALLESSDPEKILEVLKVKNVTFPFVCKTRVAHGLNSHEMAVIFNRVGLKDVSPPCVAQSFVNHNATLHKVYIIGDTLTVVQRPSLRNFPSGESEMETLFFCSQEVSKAESSSELTKPLHGTQRMDSELPNEVAHQLVTAIRPVLGASLIGVDVIVENGTGHRALIDINVFPGYDGVPDFSEHLADHISKLLDEKGQEAGEAALNGTDAVRLAHYHKIEATV